MHYLVTIGYESDQVDREGNPRIRKEKYIVEAESVEEVVVIAAKYREGDARSSESIAISKMAIECVIDHKNNPEYYKKN